MATVKKKMKLKSLSHGRPPTAKPIRNISSKKTRTLIRTHHVLEKQKAKALADGDQAKAALLKSKILAQGGIESYQRASLIGQSNERGSDSSKLLMEWLEPVIPALKKLSKIGQHARMLEVGALSITNACSKSHLYDVVRIDLNSQSDGITQQDFMERPLPRNEKEQFDIISLSLVLNYVPDPVGRGKMLLRTLDFLKTESSHSDLKDYMPALFLVLPSSCVTNSRYMDEAKLEAIIVSLGYVQVKKKLSNKLVYYLWRVDPDQVRKILSFKKTELRSGKSRNNFAIVLKEDTTGIGQTKTVFG